MKTTLMTTLALLCMAAPLLAQKEEPLFDRQGIPTYALTSTFMGEWFNPKRESESIRFRVFAIIPKLVENDRKRFSRAERAPYEIYIHFYAEDSDPRITRASYQPTVTSTTDVKRPTTVSTPIRTPINFLLVDADNNIVRKMSGDASRFRPLKGELGFGNYTIYAWSKHHAGMFGVVKDFTVHIPLTDR